LNNINKIQEKTNLNEEQIKKAITFKRKAHENSGGAESVEEPIQQQISKPLEVNRIAEKVSVINGSIIPKLG